MQSSMLKTVISPTRSFFIIAALFFLFGKVNAQYSFRGTWIATVANIDWPEKQTIGNPKLQKEHLKKMVDSLSIIGINNILFQVRPTADALYKSHMEPTSHWLLPKQGDPLVFDPLAYLIRVAHKKNIKVHAWLNPYRVNINSNDPTLTYNDSHIFKRHPSWFWKYGDQWIFNPSLEATRFWLCDVISDILCYYNVDGIHLDDYFYPYPIKGVQLPDSNEYILSCSDNQSIGDWRRENVNKTVEAVYKTIKNFSNNISFGISPFGVWRNYATDTMGSHTKAGITNYDDLYADILLWIKKGWLDYIIPQLYWEIGKPNADYATLVEWWAKQTLNTHTKLYIGMAVYRMIDIHDNKTWREGNEIAKQMRLNRTFSTVQGECYYSASVLLQNPRNICDTIKKYSTSE